MAILGTVDVAAMPVVAFSTGMLGTQGAVFCTSPTLIYLLGNVIMGTWIFHSLIAVLLAITRCMAVFHSRMTIKLFGGNKPYYWAIPAFIYAMYFVLFTKTPLFSALGFSWFFNPHFGYVPDKARDVSPV
uniref:G_PROTEIN_RECEP_F1_2 domain-containing protein n=1 Tax=Panagrellus redivivus TaxID=6233 RepID=A0A7E4UTX6_PANRE